jgi:filamentous hemagglutinin family protein
MNHTYHLVWNETRQCQVPAPETARRRGKRTGVKLIAVLLAAFTASTQALPTDGQVVAGQVDITAAGNQMTLNQASQAAIVNWQSFNVAGNEALRIRQNGVDAAMLARVVGNAGSEILGRIQADGRLYLVNQRGVIIGKDAVIDTSAFVASTLNISDSDFLRGSEFSFSGDSMAGIENLGTVRAAEGNVMLFAHTVKNSGTLQAPKGAVDLVAGNEVLLAAEDSSGVLVRTTLPAATGVDNRGLIEAAQVKLQAAGGSLYELAINQAGTVRASGVAERDGRVLLTAEDATVQVSGTVSARNDDGSGGEILVGGDMHGANPNVPNAARTVVTSTAVLDASSTAASGDGGKVVVWSDGDTRFSGVIAARGGAQGGDGGNAEVSGKRNLAFDGTADLLAPHGKRGKLLLDPADITISLGAAGANPAGMNFFGGTYTWPSASDPGAQTITNGTVNNLLDTADLDLQATNSLTVNAAISSASAHFLKLNAPMIAVNAGISLPNANLFFSSLGGTGSLTSALNAPITANQVWMGGGFAPITLAGVVTTPSLALDTLTSATSLKMTNAANSIDQVETVGPISLTGNISIASSSAMSLLGEVTAGGAVTLTSGGNLTMKAGSILTAGGLTTLASTGGAFINQAGMGLLAGAGRKRIYSTTDAGGFTDDGLGYTQYNPVTYGSDPQTGNVIYIQTASGLPLLTITANSFSRLYGASNPAFTAAYSGGSAADLAKPVKFTIQQASNNVGSYAIVPYGAISSTSRLSYVNGTLTIDPAPLQITANNASKTYGAITPTFSAQISGLLNGDSSTIVSGLQFSTAATTGSAVGSYDIVPSGASVAVPFGGTVPNYTINSYVNGVLTVNPALLTATAPDALRLYGDPNVLNGTVQYSGFVNGDTASIVTGLQLNTPATVASPVGNYPVTASGATAPNYTIQYVDGKLIVHKAPLWISVNDATREVGQPNPPFSATFSGLKNGDTSSVLSGMQLDTSAGVDTPAGTYTIRVSALGSAANYVPQVLRNGSLTINNPPPAIQLLFTPMETKKLDFNTLGKLVVDNSPKVSIATLFLGSSDPALRSAQSNLLSKFSKELGKSGIKLSSDQINLALADPATRDYMMGTLLPYLYKELSSILDIEPSKWTPEQQAYATTMMNYIRDQKIAAAAKSQKDYAAWEKAQRDKREEILKLGGMTGVTLDFLNSSNPELPPPEILEQAQNGVVMTNAQLKSYASQTVVLGEMNKEAERVQAIADKGVVQAEVDWLSNKLKNQDVFTKTYTYDENGNVASSTKVNRFNEIYSALQRLEKANSMKYEKFGFGPDPVELAAAKQQVADIYAIMKGPKIDVHGLVTQALSLSPSSGSGTSTDHSVGYLAGSIAEAGKAVIFGVVAFGGDLNANGMLSSVSGALRNKILPFAQKRALRYEQRVQMGMFDDVKAINKGTDIVEGITDGAQALNKGTKTLETMSKFTKFLSAADKVLGPAGLVLDVLGNLVQIGVGAAQYAQIGDYKNALDKTVQDAKKEITVNDLKAMRDSGALFNYLNIMTASGGKVGDQ